MQTELKNRILANILIDSRPEHIMLPRRRRITIAAISPFALAGISAIGLFLLILSKLRAVLH